MSSVKRKVVLTPWEKIVKAGDEHRGLRLTWEEVWMLRMDDAIAQAAINETEKRESGNPPPCICCHDEDDEACPVHGYTSDRSAEHG